MLPRHNPAFWQFPSPLSGEENYRTVNVVRGGLVLAGLRRPRAQAVAATLLSLVLGATMIQSQSACGEEAPPSPTNAEQTQVATPANVIADRALKVFASTNPTGDFPYNVISGTSLARMLASSEEKSKLFLLDIRSRTDYDQGHIEGSTQVEFGQWAAPENLARYPRNKKIVVIHDVAHYAGEATGGLRMLGYEAVTLRGGMSGWAQGYRQAQIAQELSGPFYPVDTVPAEAPAAPPDDVPFDVPSDADYGLLAAKVTSIFGVPRAAYDAVTAEELNRMLQTEENFRPFVVDVRQLNDFNIGHVPWAVNIPFQSLGLPENLEKLPRDRKVVVVCYQGAMAGQIVTVLRMLDYDAVLLKYGMMGWDGAGKETFLKYINTARNPVVTSP